MYIIADEDGTVYKAESSSDAEVDGVNWEVLTVIRCSDCMELAQGNKLSSTDELNWNPIKNWQG